jgi:(p)ppGpp synthase/HD superfamily hydrolase
MPEAELVELVSRQGFSIANMSYHGEKEGDFFEYSMTIRTPRKHNMGRLSNVLSGLEPIIEFRIQQTGDAK